MPRPATDCARRLSAINTPQSIAMAIIPNRALNDKAVMTNIAPGLRDVAFEPCVRFISRPFNKPSSSQMC